MIFVSKPTVIFLIAALVLTGCGGSSNKTTSTTSSTSTTSTTTAETTNPVGPPPTLKLTAIAALNQPTAMAQRDGDDAIYVTEREGRIRAIRANGLDPVPLLDLTREIRSTGGEQGLLGLAFAPNSSKLYVNFTDLSGNTQIVEFTLDVNGAIDQRSRRNILSQEQPYSNHNGGQLKFGPDGMLYIGLGDGGSANDPHKNGQNLSTLLGKILRINPQPSVDGSPYSIPFDNPFANQAGARGEIWTYGMRNPWRFSFDRKTGDLWIGDVGQGKWEEVDVLLAGEKNRNFGWSRREGSHELTGSKPSDAIDPVYEYDHSGGNCSITGGYVYRGRAIPELTGRYLFADYCVGIVTTLTKRGTSWQADKTNLQLPLISSFGEDHNGELYVLSLQGTVARIDAG